MSKNHASTRILFGTLTAIILALGTIGTYIYTRHTVSSSSKSNTSTSTDIYTLFMMENFDKIRANYWQKTKESDVATHFQASLQSVLGITTPPPLETQDRAGAEKMFAATFVATSTEARKNLALDTLIVALRNLAPQGRNAILSQAQETAFRQQVSNIDQAKDLYADLGLAKGADKEAVKAAYDSKVATLANDQSPAAKAELAKVSHAQDVLTNPNTKDLYDTAKIEPTSSKNIIGKTLYVKIDRISPTTLIEFGRTIYAASTTPGLTNLIIDLRHNLGGALDFAQGFLGLFLGPQQFAFDLYHQDVYDAQRTTEPRFQELARYANIVILTDDMTQSTAEVTTAAFKRFKLATIVGGTTRGWGTVENTFPIETMIDPGQKYQLLLTHSITLREDNLPIEGRGIEPDINIKDPSWKKTLEARLKSLDFARTVESIVSKPVQ